MNIIEMHMQASHLICGLNQTYGGHVNFTDCKCFVEIRMISFVINTNIHIDNVTVL